MKQVLQSVFDVIYIHLVRLRIRYAVIGIVLAASLFVHHTLISPPSAFPDRQNFIVEKSVSAARLAQQLDDAHIIRSSTVFLTLAKILGTDGRLQSGTYYFERPLDVLTVLYRLETGTTGIKPIVVTIKEGATSYEIADILSRAIPDFDTERFYLLAREKEGMLFPETYNFVPSDTVSSVLERLEQTFDKKISTINTEIVAFERPLPEILIMASILEKEGRTLEERRQIAGVLYNRLSINMALQVDAVFGYINQRETYHPSLDDLEVNSPYNTYKFRGLPPGPICNPSLDSILASVTPIHSNYLYYLTGKDGVTRFATTFEEHKMNRERYLD